MKGHPAAPIRRTGGVGVPHGERGADLKQLNGRHRSPEEELLTRGGRDICGAIEPPLIVAGAALTS